MCARSIPASSVQRPAFSPDGRRGLFTDSFAQEDLLLRSRSPCRPDQPTKTFVKTDPKDGYPDGMTVDSEGYLWNAMWDGWSVIR